MKTNPIPFGDLKKFNDSNSCVIIALLVNEGDVVHIDRTLQEIGFSKGKNIIGYHHVEGSVMGENGRSDFLFEFDHPEIPFSPLARLKIEDLKWTSDFVDNYASDYYSI